jgi:hypothetical protein
MTARAIEIVELWWEDLPEFYHCKGHVERDAFATALAAFLGCEASDFPAGLIRHEYARNECTGYARCMGLNHIVRLVGRGRGAYPVTVFRNDACTRRGA